MKKFLISVLITLLSVGLMIPMAVPVVAQTSYIETIYLVDTLDLTADDGSTIYTVDLVDSTPNKAELTYFVGMPDNARYDTVAALACSPDGDILYVIDRDTSWLAKYDIGSASWTQVGATGLSNCVQLVCAADGALYASSNNSDSIWIVDTATAATTFIGLIKNGSATVNVQGADIAFAADGTLYLWTDGGTQGLYTLSLPVSPPADVTASYIGNSVPDYGFTGLAIRGGGAGDLIGSTTDDFIRQVSTSDASIVASYRMYLDDEEYDYAWGDMTIGELAVEEGEPSIQITKSTDFEGKASIGDVIDYAFEVYNDGELDLEDIELHDDLIGDTPGEISGPTGDDGDGILNPLETWYYAGSYGPLDEDDIAGCELVNIVTVRGYYDEGETDYVEDSDFASVPTAKRLNLWAGKYTDVGFVEIWNDGDCLHIIYQIDDGMPWEITEVHLYVGSNEPPLNTPGQFPFDIGDAESVSATAVEFCIPLEDIDGYSLELNKKGKPTGKIVADGNPGVEARDPVYIAAHAVVMNVSCYQTGFVYGIERYTGNVYEVDVLSGASSLVFTITPPPAVGSAKPNGLAYNDANGFIYFCDYQPTTTLYFWDGASQQTAGSLLLDAAGAPVGDIADADFYNGEYYFVTGPPYSDLLYKVSFNADGTASGPPVMIGAISGGAHGYTFNGDIAIKNGVIYGWGLCGVDGNYEFFKVNVDGTGFMYVTPSYQSSLQLAFGSDGTLYGHRSGGTGEFFAIGTDIADFGVVSSIGWNVQGHLYTDCASGEICVPYDETAWGGWGDDLENVIPFEDNNWSNYIEFFVMGCQGNNNSY